jgi:cyclohexyl-isocyanide hydratase
MKVLAVVFPGMTPLDLIGPLQAIGFMPDVELQTVWKTAGAVQTDTGVSLLATHGFADAFTDPDILVIGGAAGPTLAVMQDAEALTFLADRGQRARWLVSVCTGSLILGAAGLLRGYRASSYWSVREHLAAFGAQPCADRVVFDRNRLSGGGVTAGIDVGLALAGELLGEDTGRLFELLMEYAPAPPYGTGRPELAGPELTAQAQALLGTVIPASAIEAIAAKCRERWKSEG